jgi:glycosyltransferase involved in cell wall biosynthesis
MYDNHTILGTVYNFHRLRNLQKPQFAHRGSAMALPPQQRLAMGQAGRAHIVANFDMERIVDRWEQLYLQLLEQKGMRLHRP